MKPEDVVKVKLVGSQERLEETIEKLDLHYIVVKTSQFIEHKNDTQVHCFLTLLEARYS